MVPGSGKFPTPAQESSLFCFHFNNLETRKKCACIYKIKPTLIIFPVQVKYGEHIYILTNPHPHPHI